MPSPLRHALLVLVAAAACACPTPSTPTGRSPSSHREPSRVVQRARTVEVRPSRSHYSATLEGSTLDELGTIAISRDEEDVFGVTLDGREILVWDASDGSLKRTLAGPAPENAGLDVVGLALLGADEALAISLKPEALAAAPYTVVVSLRDGRLAGRVDGGMATASRDGTLLATDARDGVRVYAWPQLESLVLLPVKDAATMQFAPGGKLLSVGSLFGSVVEWDIQRETPRSFLEQEVPLQVRSLSYSDDAGLLLAATMNYSSRGIRIDGGTKQYIFDTRTGRVAQVWPESPNIGAAAFLDDGRRIVYYEWDSKRVRTARLLQQGGTVELGHEWQSPEVEYRSFLAAASRGQAFVAASGRILCFDAVRGEICYGDREAPASARRVTFSSNGKRLAVDRVEVLEPRATIADIWTDEGVRDTQIRLPFLDTGTLTPLGASGIVWASDAKLHVRGLESDGACIIEEPAPSGIDQSFRLLVPTDDMGFAAVRGDGRVSLFHGCRRVSDHTFEGRVRDVAFDPGTRRLGILVTNAEGRRHVHRFGLQDGSEERGEIEHQGEKCKLSGDLNRVACLDGVEVHLSDASSERESRTVRFDHVEQLLTLAFSRDGQVVLATAAERRIGWANVLVGYDAATETTYRFSRAHRGYITDVAISPDGCRAASSDLNGVVHEWAIPRPGCGS